MKFKIVALNGFFISLLLAFSSAHAAPQIITDSDRGALMAIAVMTNSLPRSSLPRYNEKQVLGVSTRWLALNLQRTFIFKNVVRNEILPGLSGTAKALVKNFVGELENNFNLLSRVKPYYNDWGLLDSNRIESYAVTTARKRVQNWNLFFEMTPIKNKDRYIKNFAKNLRLMAPVLASQLPDVKIMTTLGYMDLDLPSRIHITFSSSMNQDRKKDSQKVWQNLAYQQTALAKSFVQSAKRSAVDFTSTPSYGSTLDPWFKQIQKICSDTGLRAEGKAAQKQLLLDMQDAVEQTGENSSCGARVNRS